MNAAPSPAMEVSSPWGQTRAFEWIFIVLGGLPLFLPFVLWAGEGELSRQDPVYWYFWMSAIFSAPHVYSTYLRLDRKLAEKRVNRLFGFPAYLGWVGLLLLARKGGFFLQTMTAINVWQTIHYVRQGWGVNRFFSRGSGEDDLDRRLYYWAFHLAMPLFVFGRWDTLYTVWRGVPSNVIIPVRFPPLFMDGCWVLFLLAVGLGLFAEARKLGRGPRSYDPMGLATLLGFYVVHAYGFLSVTHYQRGFFAVTIYHGVQYLGLLWLLENQAAARPRVAARATRILGRFPFLLFWVLCFGGSYLWEQHVAARGNLFWPGISLVVLGAVSAHHYFVDSVLWRAKVGK